MRKKKRRVYHGWVIVEPYGAEGYKDIIWVEYRDNPESAERLRKQVGNGESGCATAVEWWDKRLGQPVKLEPALKGSYRVYIEEEVAEESGQK